MKNYVNDMTNGNPTRLLLSFTMPMLVGNIFQQLYNIVDSIIVGKFVGADGLAAVGATGSVNFLIVSLCIGLSAGIGIVVSQYFGAKDTDYVKHTIANAMYLLLFSAILMFIAGFFFARPFLQALKTPDNILNDAVLYMRVICCGIFTVDIYNGVSSILRALGDSKTPLIFLIISSFLNIALDLIFIITFHLGVFGAAFATVLSEAIAGIGCTIWAIKKNPYFQMPKSFFKMDASIMKKCSKLGLPVALQNAMIAISCIVLQSVVNTFGSTVVAAFTVTSRIEQLVQQPYGSLGTAVSTYAGQNMGAGEINRVKAGYRKSYLIMGAFTLIMVPVAQLFGHQIVQLFVSSAETEVITLGTQALKITSWFYFPLGMIYITRGLLNGVGDATYAFINGIIEMLGRICFAKPLTMVAGIGVWGVWLATALTWLVTGIISALRYLQGKWKNKGVVEHTTVHARA